VKTAPDSQITDAEKILIRALTSATQLQSEESVSDRSGEDDAFDPARQARFVLAAERLHVGLATESLIDALLNAPAETQDIMDTMLSPDDRRVLATILMKDDEELSAEKIEGATRALIRVQIRRRLEDIQRQVEALRAHDPAQLKVLMDEKLRLKRALMNPGVTGDQITAASVN
jgi:hypothetical protein